MNKAFSLPFSKFAGLIFLSQIFLSQCGGAAAVLPAAVSTAPASSLTPSDQTQIPILMYHYIGPIPPDQLNNALRKDLTVSQENFEAQLKWLSENNYETVYFQEVLDFVNHASTPTPAFASLGSKKPIVLSFDDGYESAYSVAFPLLKKYKMKGAFAIITGKIEMRKYLTWSQISVMQAAGMEILSHTVTHADLSILTAPQIEDELTTSKEQLEAILGHQVKGLIYPSGKYTGRVIRSARNLYEGARATQRGVVTKNSKPFELPTVRIRGSTTLEQFSHLFTDF